jgi:hypothetical protein
LRRSERTRELVFTSRRWDLQRLSSASLLEPATGPGPRCTPPGRHPPGDLTWVICVDEDRIVEIRAYFDDGLVEELFRTTER